MTKETKFKIEAGIKTLEQLEMTWANVEKEHGTGKWPHSACMKPFSTQSKMFCYNTRITLTHLLAADNSNMPFEEIRLKTSLEVIEKLRERSLNSIETILSFFKTQLDKCLHHWNKEKIKVRKIFLENLEKLAKILEDGLEMPELREKELVKELAVSTMEAQQEIGRNRRMRIQVLENDIRVLEIAKALLETL